MERAVEILSLSIVHAVIKAKSVHRSSMLLLTECCHQSKGGFWQGKEKMIEYFSGVNEKVHHWVFSRCFAGACEYNNSVFQALACCEINCLLRACMWPLGHINLIVRFSSSRLQIFNEAGGNLQFKFQRSCQAKRQLLQPIHQQILWRGFPCYCVREHM